MNQETRGWFFFSMGFPFMGKVCSAQENKVSPKKNGNYLITTAARQKRIIKINQSGAIKCPSTPKTWVRTSSILKYCLFSSFPANMLKEITTFSLVKGMTTQRHFLPSKHHRIGVEIQTRHLLFMLKQGNRARMMFSYSFIQCGLSTYYV